MLFFKDPDLGEGSVSGQTPSSSCSTNRVEQYSEGVLENAFLVFEKMIMEVDEFSKKSKNTCFSKNHISSKEKPIPKRQRGFCRTRSPLQNAPIPEVTRLDFYGLMIFLRWAFFQRKKLPIGPKNR